MKKFAKFLLIAMVAVISVAALSACNGSGSTVNVSWASSEVETLSYSIHDTSKNPDYQSTLNVVGEATFVTAPKLTDAEKEDYDDATVKLTSTVKLDKVGTSETVFYANRYTVVHLTKTYTDATDVTKNYVLTADHSGKYYKYTLNYANAPEKNKSGKLNVGSSGFADGEFLYMYLRCYNIDNGSVPSSVSVADPFTDTVTKVSFGKTSSQESVKTENAELGTVICNEVSVNRSESPIGTGIKVCYLPASMTFGNSKIKSVRFPTKITENNLVYVLKDYSVIG